MDRSERLIQLISEKEADAFLIMNIENSARASSVYFPDSPDLFLSFSSPKTQGFS